MIMRLGVWTRLHTQQDKGNCTVYKTNKYHHLMAIIGAEDENIDHTKKNIPILISGRSIAFWRQTGAGSGP